MEKIYLPVLNDTADKVLPRIIPAPNGDCKLITHPDDEFFPDYNLTMNGLPSAIACGLTAAINVTGTAISVEGDNNAETPHLISDPNQSTDQGTHFVAPPPKAPFKPLASTDYVCIGHGADPPFCLPPGSCQKQSGMGFNIKDVDTLTLPSREWSLTTHWKHLHQSFEAGPAKDTEKTFTTNQDPKKKSKELSSFKDQMDAIDVNLDGEAYFRISGPNDGPDPVCCLFSEPNFSGNVWCMGVGGEDVLPQWKDKASSVSCHGEGEAYPFAKEYGDGAELHIAGNAEDLSGHPFGNGTITNKVKALWVTKG